MSIVDRLTKEVMEGQLEELRISKSEALELAGCLRAMDQQGKYTELKWYRNLIEGNALKFLGVPVKVVE